MKLVNYSAVVALSTVLISTGVASMMNVQALEKESDSEIGYEREFDSKSDVNFIPSGSSTIPIDPTEPGNPNPPTPEPSKPGTDGPLSIDFASNFEFGTQEITTEDVVYMAKPQTYVENENETPTFVQVTDKRGTNAGWSLNLKQEDQFKNENTQNEYIVGAELRFLAGEEITNGKGKKPSTYEAKLDAETGAFSKIMTAEATEGSGTWVSMFGGTDGLVDYEVIDDKGNVTTEKRDSGVTLSIPGSSQTDAVEYETTLNWQLTNEPGNGTGNKIEE